MITPMIREYVETALIEAGFEVDPDTNWIRTTNDDWEFYIDQHEIILDVEIHDPEYPDNDWDSRWIWGEELSLSDPKVLDKLIKILSNPATHLEEKGIQRDCICGDPNDPLHKEMGSARCYNSICHALWDDRSYFSR